MARGLPCPRPVCCNQIVSCHGVPTEVLSDCRQAFLSGLIKEVDALLSFHTSNTSAYHPEMDGLVERFNRTRTAILAKAVEKGKDWDQHLPFVPVCISGQSADKYTGIFLLYRRDPRLPVE